tara:strand:+ start:875 stop:1099 length:225 start_codon:yes stop_codon:yes gene_type:complete
MTEEKINTIGDQEIKNEDLTSEQQHYKNHVISLRNKIAKLQFEIDDLAPSLKFHEDALIETTKPKEDQASAEES